MLENELGKVVSYEEGHVSDGDGPDQTAHSGTDVAEGYMRGKYRGGGGQVYWPQPLIHLIPSS